MPVAAAECDTDNNVCETICSNAEGDFGGCLDDGLDDGLGGF